MVKEWLKKFSNRDGTSQSRHELFTVTKNMSATVLQNDALIARSEYTHDCFVVTENVKDFSLLQKVMPKLEVIPAADFFS